MATKTLVSDFSLRDEALKMLDGRGAILDTARDISAYFREAEIFTPVIGGVAVVLHGYVRTTTDIDIVATDSMEAVARVLMDHGFMFDPARKEFLRAGIPVHLVRGDQVGEALREQVEIDGITTVTLVDLIAMKLRTGLKYLTRAIDIADVIGLARHHRLGQGFARHLDKSLRPEFRKLVKAIAAEENFHS